MNAHSLPIGMAEMNRIFEVVDEQEISRELIQVELLPSRDGTVERLPTGKIRIVLPENVGLGEWLPTLERALRSLSADGSENR